MNRIIFFIILTLFLFLFFLLNRYVVSRGVLALEGTHFQTIFKWAYWLLSSFFIVGQFLERGNPHKITEVISGIGSLWLAWFMYTLILVLLVDFIRLSNHFLHFIPNPVTTVIPNGLLVFLLVFLSGIAIVTYGYSNARNPIVKNITVTTGKNLSHNLKIALVSDLHIGAIVSNGKIEKMVTMMNELSPDIILIAGDLVDHNPKFAIKDKVGKQFEKLHPPMGIFAVTGNHEYIGEAEVSVEYLQKYGIHYLRDSVVNIGNTLQIAGREDRQKQLKTGVKRLDISELLKNTNPDIPVILMDHQPVEYDHAVASGVDLMVSGHTHKGQMWPMNYITKAVFENDYGLYEKGKTWFYTSNGFGTWGPPVRVGNTPEVVLITLTHAKN